MKNEENIGKILKQWDPRFIFSWDVFDLMERHLHLKQLPYINDKYF